MPPIDTQSATRTPITPQVDTADAQAASEGRTQGAAAPAGDLSALQEKPNLSPLQRFGLAVARVVGSNSYPLAGHIRDELHESIKGLSAGGSDTPAEVDVDGLTAQLQAKRDELIARAKTEMADHVNDLKGKLNDDLNAAVESVRVLIKAAGDEQIAAVKSTKAG